jgi:hypothetical protein
MKFQNLLVLPLIFAQFLTFGQQTKTGVINSASQVYEKHQSSGNSNNAKSTHEVKTSGRDIYTSGSTTIHDAQNIRSSVNNNISSEESQKIKPISLPPKNISLRSNTKGYGISDAYLKQQKNGLLFADKGYINRVCHSQALRFYPGYYYTCDLKGRRLHGYGVQVGLYKDLENVRNDVIKYTYAFKKDVYFFVDISNTPYRYRLIIGRYTLKTPALKLRNELWKYFPGCFVIRYCNGLGVGRSGSNVVVDKFAVTEDF